MRVNNIQGIKSARILFELAERRACEYLQRDNMLAAACWAQIAATMALGRHPGFFVSSLLEELLLKIAQRINTDVAIVKDLDEHSTRTHTKTKYLHVLTLTDNTGGHTRVVEKWIRNTLNSGTHSVITTQQNYLASEGLVDAINISGGWYESLSDPKSNLLQRALILRNIAYRWADVIVLHVHGYDVVPIIAFGINGGPPVIYFNHADHLFWLGTSVADVVADIRLTGQKLSVTKRGITNSKILPIPLHETHISITRDRARKELGIKEHTIVMLTVGSAYKFAQVGEYNFVQQMTEILRRHENAVLIAIGPREDNRWKTASENVKGRIKALGIQNNLDLYWKSSDIYIDPYPMSSFTAMLEVGLLEIPVIGLENLEAPILTNYDVVHDWHVTHSTSHQQLEDAIDQLILNPDDRIKNGRELAKNIKRVHSGQEWNAYLQKIIDSLPINHMIRKPMQIEAEPDAQDIFLNKFQTLSLPNYTIKHAIAPSGRYLSFYDRFNLIKDVFHIGILPLKTFLSDNTLQKLNKIKRHIGSWCVFN